MAAYYLDLETYSPTRPIDFHKDPIISIAYQQMDSRTGETQSPLTILKSWESSEDNILKAFYEAFNVHNRWAFIPIGCKLTDFDLLMLGTHWKKIGINLDAITLFNHPHIDIYPVLLLCNKGEFKGCSLEHFAGKQHSGDKVAEWFTNKDYSSLESYIKDETEAFIRLYAYLVTEMPNLWYTFAKENGIVV